MMLKDLLEENILIRVYKMIKNIYLSRLLIKMENHILKLQ